MDAVNHSDSETPLQTCSGAFAHTFTSDELWSVLSSSKVEQEVFQAWISLQFSLFSGVERIGLFVRKKPDLPLILSAAHPPELPCDDLMKIVVEADQEKRGVLRKREGLAGKGLFQAAYPVVLEDTIYGVIAFEAITARSTDIQLLMRQVQWGAAWVREYMRRLLHSDASLAHNLSGMCLDVLATVIDKKDVKSASRVFCTELARLFNCERVSVGFVKRKRIKVTAMSHAAQFGKQMNMVRLIANCMDEAVDQCAILVLPEPEDEVNILRAHHELSHQFGSRKVLTLPLFVKDRFIGGLTLERDAGEDFSDKEISALDAIAASTAIVLNEKRLHDRNVLVRLGTGLMNVMRGILGPTHTGRKLAAVVLVLLGTVFYYWKQPYRVTAEAMVEGETLQTIAVGFDGFISKSGAKAGDIVTKGDLLASLDDTELTLEKLQWEAERQSKKLEYDRALGTNNRAESLIAEKQMEQAETRIQLVEEQIEHTQLRAPVSGLVISGDVSQMIGSAVQRGQVLFEIAPVDRYRVRLMIDESQIGDVATGQAGQLVLTALPEEIFPVSITKIIPISEAGNGKNLFQVDAVFQGSLAALRPGMKGIAKISIDERRTLWIWTRPMVKWMQLKYWQFFG